MPAHLVRFVRFLLVGGGATALHYSILIILVQATPTSPVIASSIGFCISAVFNYALNRRFTFQSGRPHSQSIPRFIVVAAMGLGINALFMYVLHDLVGAHYLAAQIVATAATLVWNFVLNLIWTFSHPSREVNTRIEQ